MKVLLSWLREFAPIEGSPDEIAEVLSDLGLAVEEQRVVGEGLDGIVVARVEGLRPHPNADKIQLVDVDPGRALRPEGEATLQICCGAFNMAVGDLVPLATLGTTPRQPEIRRATRPLRSPQHGLDFAPARYSSRSNRLARRSDEPGAVLVRRRRARRSERCASAEQRCWSSRTRRQACCPSVTVGSLLPRS